MSDSSSDTTVEPRRHSNSTRFDATHFSIGVHSRSVGSYDRSNEYFMGQRHWAVVIRSPTDYRTIELLTDGKAIFIRDMLSSAVDFDVVASYSGEKLDFDEVLKHHPMRHSGYSPCFNNCQHFAATFLILLQAYANAHPGRYFNPQQRYTDITSSVMVGDGFKLWNRPNWGLQAAQALTLPTAAVASGVAVAASHATVAVPATGILGWLGVTTTAPAWFAATAATAVPVCLGAAAVTSVEYVRRCYVWKKASKFPDPRVQGFPKEHKRPLTPDERAPLELQAASVDKYGLIGSLIATGSSNVSSNVSPSLSSAVPAVPSLFNGVSP